MKSAATINYRKIVLGVWILFFSTILGISLLIASIHGNWWGLWGGMPDFKQLENPKTGVASELISSDGIVLGKYFRENRTPVRYENLSPHLINALKATEDIRFEEHSGIDFVATLAIVPYLIVGRKRGSSTITQQLAKNLFDTRCIRSKDNDCDFKGKLLDVPIIGTIGAKIKEWILAIKLEKSYTKKEIITMYLNTVDFGSNAFGVKVAAQTFFKTTPDKLTISQSATLVGVLKAPTLYSPVLNPENAIRRRNTVLYQMYKYKFITKTQYEQLIQEPLQVQQTYEVESHNTGLATYFRSVVGNYLLEWCKENGYDLYSDGLKIYTTIHSRMQQYMEEAVDKHMRHQQKLFFEHWKGRNPWIDEEMRELPNFMDIAVRRTEHYKKLAQLKEYQTADGSPHHDKIVSKMKEKPSKPYKVFTWDSPTFEKDTLLSPWDSIRYYKHFLQIGMMCMEPLTGHIKAWVGGINYKYFKYDHVKQGARQPGSAFKPIVYCAAIAEKGFHPCSKVVDAPITFTMHDGTTWTPKNSENYSNSVLTLRSALAQSINTVAAYLIKELSEGQADGTKGAKIVADFAQNKLGIKSKLDPIPSICLGSSDVSVYELTGAYAAFVNHGIWTEPIFITKIEDRHGKILQQFVPKTIEAMSEEIAYTMVYMLRGTTEEKNGTAQSLWQYKFKQGNEVAGKTGTTSNYSDAWFIGMTKDLCTGVWTGGDDRSIHFRSVQYGQGARQAMPAFAYFMEKVYEDSTLGYQKGAFPRPKTYRIELDCSEYERSVNPGSYEESIQPYSPNKPTIPDDIF
ncbi:MAG: transglycosylase domain-containing protein [Cytophagales bacterium]|nr:transglycosylase domain-containing protein [Cytophagales bacterium]MDW8383790.1 transglycosylase domain-containing protein [Flammeovirgaceae bacterium]